MQVRNKTMHSPKLELTDEEMEEQFDKITDLFLDDGLKKYSDMNNKPPIANLDTILEVIPTQSCMPSFSKFLQDMSLDQGRS